MADRGLVREATSISEDPPPFRIEEEAVMYESAYRELLFAVCRAEE